MPQTIHEPDWPSAPSLQATINSGLVWRLEGAAGRGAMNAIESGMAILGIVGHRDYYGNYVPSRSEVDPGTKGSVAYANAIRKEYGLRPLHGHDFDIGTAAVLELEAERDA